MIGKTIAHYKILEKLGQGGMGVVYKAEDTKLNRTVALKFLPTQQLAPSDDKLRFEQEAKAAAQLSHANIATVFEINEHEGQTFIAMEYIEGETLADKVVDRPLKFKDALKIASQVAAGLHAAHEQGIVHRDIKSANIMLTQKGVVKIMDFGLAKMSQTSMKTKAGTTLGTISYMSPEQASGEGVDHRSDIWSLGVVLYEMISGQLPFRGDYEQAIVFSILNEEPEPLTAVRTGVPMDLERIVNKLLAKDPDNRYQNVVELPVDLKNVSLKDVSTSRISSSVVTQSISQQKELNVKVRYPWKTLLTVVATAALAFLLAWFLKPGSPALMSGPVNKFGIQLPETMVSNFSNANRLALSPDGTNLVFMGRQSGERGLFLKKGTSFEIERMARIELGRSPFFSPDGKWIGYFGRANVLYKVLTDGGEPLRITQATQSHNGATWAPDNTIIFAAIGCLMRVSDSGGEAVQLTEANHPNEHHLFPHMLPDDQNVLFTVRRHDAELSASRLAVYRLGDDDYQLILNEEGYNAVYSPTGHILYGRANQLMAVPFDLENLSISGTPVPVLDNVQTHAYWGGMSYALSEEGTIVYVTGSGLDEQRSVLSVDMTGTATELFDLKKAYTLARIAPDGRSIALRIEEQNTENIWIYDVDGGAINQLTFYPKGSDVGWFAWSPESRRLAYATSAEDSSNGIYIRRGDGSGPVTKIYTSPSPRLMNICDWSSQGDKLLVTQIVPGNGYDIFVYSFEDGSMTPFQATPSHEGGPAFSPDGKWVAYAPNTYRGEGGGLDVFVRPLSQDDKGIWKITTDPGSQPVWSPDGKKIFFRRDTHMFSVDVDFSGEFSRQTPRKLFEGHFFLDRGRRWDVWPDGRGFVMIQNPVNDLRDQKIYVIQGFAAELKRLAPVE